MSARLLPVALPLTAGLFFAVGVLGTLVIGRDATPRAEPKAVPANNFACIRAPAMDKYGIEFYVCGRFGGAK